MPRKRPKSPAQELGSTPGFAGDAMLGKDAALFEKSPPALGLGLMTLSEVAQSFGKADQTIRNWVARREIPFLMLGNQIVFRRDSLREWLQKMENKPRGRH